MREAYFAGGCFWCIGYCFERLEGVTEVESGFSGGKEVNPTYEDVKAQLTGHRETIKITYDENKTTYEELLNIFFQNVDLYDNEGQFIDKGHSYTLAIYYEREEEKETALRLLKLEEEKSHQEPCVSLEKFDKFYTAEEYHQHFALKNPEEFENELIASGRKDNK